MPVTEPLPTRSPTDTSRDQTAGLVGSLLLHTLLIGGVLAGGLALHHKTEPWGQSALEAGAIQATAVSSLPLPPRQKTLDTGVLTSEHPSPAPTPAKPATQPPPSPQDLALQRRQPPTKTAPAPTPEAPKHPQPTPPQPTKATTGESAGIRIPQATMQLHNGTASVAVQDRAFGARFAYYVQIVNRTVAQNWFTQEADPTQSQGKRAVITFDIDRDGVPSNPRLTQRSGSPTLDQSALRAVQRVDGFGPLPAGDHITVEYAFDYRQQ